MASKNILVLDPDKGVGTSLANILRGVGYRVAAGHSQQDAATLLSNSDFDLVITEALGQTDLFHFDPTFLTELRSATGSTPIILCSICFSADQLRVGDFGLAEVIPQPSQLASLLAKVRMVLSTTGLEPNLV